MALSFIRSTLSQYHHRNHRQSDTPRRQRQRSSAADGFPPENHGAAAFQLINRNFPTAGRSEPAAPGRDRPYRTDSSQARFLEIREVPKGEIAAAGRLRRVRDGGGIHTVV